MDVIIRNLSENVVHALDRTAAEAGMSREAWLRRELETLAPDPALCIGYVELIALGDTVECIECGHVIGHNENAYAALMETNTHGPLCEVCAS